MVSLSKSNHNASLSALLLCDFTEMSIEHLNFPVERKYANHNEGKNMLITICLFSQKNVPI